VPTDFGEVAEHALDEAMELAASLGAIVTVLHAYEYSLLGIGVDFGTGVPDAPERLKRAAREALRETIERQSGRGVVLDGILREGAPWSAIVEFAAGSNADLIVMGTRGRRGLARAFLGSVAEKVVRYASVPVLTVHASPDVAVVAREPSRGQAPRSEGVGR
jgi:nucleotide-binding universal stress UspA family protein